MTYCVAIKVNDGLVFAADTRTSASVDDIRTYNKVHTFEFPGDRIFILMSAGNLATTQAVLAQIQRDLDAGDTVVNIKNVRHMYDAAEYLGIVSVRAQKHMATEAPASAVDFRTTLILGGQIQNEATAIYLIYPEGNCIAASPETPYVQIGELKYGKPILDRVIRGETTLEDAARCALVSLDSTMRSNISVGPPLDLAILPTNTLKVSRRMRLDLDTPYYAQLRDAWGRSILNGFRSLPRFEWENQAMQLPLQQAAQGQQQNQQVQGTLPNPAPQNQQN
jgi:putative proteasome-type protease